MDLLAETADFQSNYFFEKKKKADNDFANQLIISASYQAFPVGIEPTIKS